MTTPRRIALLLISALAFTSVAPAYAARVQESRTIKAVKVGAACTKLNAKAKVGSTAVVCKRVNGKLIWAKVTVSADCKKARDQYNSQNASYTAILKQLSDARKSLEGLTGADADALRNQVNDLEKTIQSLSPVLKQFKIATDQICALS